jgi:hypothetical protein
VRIDSALEFDLCRVKVGNLQRISGRRKGSSPCSSSFRRGSGKPVFSPRPGSFAPIALQGLEILLKLFGVNIRASDARQNGFKVGFQRIPGDQVAVE